MTSKRSHAELYADVPLFKKCSKKELAKIGALSTRVDIASGRVLCRQGEPGFEAFVIVEGEASVDIDGEEIAVLGPGEFFGEMALLDGSARVATVTATTPMEVLVLNMTEFRQMLEESPSVAIAMLEGVAGRLRDAGRPGGRLPTGV